MRKILYISLAILACISCAHSNKEADTLDVSETSEAELTDLTANETPADFSNNDLARQKLQDYLDLYLLEQKHPEFKEDIASQLKNVSAERLLLPEGVQIDRIVNIRQKGELLWTSDSVQELSFYFDIVINQNTITDSITAVLTKKNVTIDGTELIATKVLFKSNQ